MAPLLKMIGPMMLGMTAGSMVGHLAQRSFGPYDLPIPRPPADELAAHRGQPRRVRHRVEPAARRPAPVGLPPRGHPPRRARRPPRAGPPRRAAQPLPRRASSPTPVASRTSSASLEHLDPAVPRLQQLFGDPEVVLGAMQSPAQRALLPQLDALVAVIVGYVDHVMDTSAAACCRATGCSPRRCAAGGSRPTAADRFVERLLRPGADPGRSTTGARAFVDGVVERAGERGPGPPLACRPRAAHAGRGRRPRPLARPHRPPDRDLIQGAG